jgi:hypothetical protein
MEKRKFLTLLGLELRPPGYRAKSLCLISWVLCHEDIWGSGGMAPSFLNSPLERSTSRPCHFTLGKEIPVPIGYEAGWAPEPVWTLWRREQSCNVGNRTRVVQLLARRYTEAAIPTLGSREKSYITDCWTGFRLLQILQHTDITQLSTFTLYLILFSKLRINIYVKCEGSSFENSSGQIS